MKLNELDSTSNAMMMLARTVPHMAAASMDTSPQNVSRFTGVEPSMVEKLVPQMVKRMGPNLAATAGDMPAEAHAVIAAVRYMQTNKIAARDRTPDFFESLTDLPYDDLYQAAANNLSAIAQQVANFRLNWMEVVRNKKFADLSSEQQKAMITHEMQKLSQGQHGKVAAIDIAKALIYSHNLTDNPESLRRAIDKLLSSQSGDMAMLDRYRVKGQQHRPSEDTSNAIRVHPNASY